MEKINVKEADRLIAEAKERFEEIRIRNDRKIVNIQAQINECKCEIGNILFNNRSAEADMRREIREINLRVMHPDTTSMTALRNRVSAIEEKLGLNKEEGARNE